MKQNIRTLIVKAVAPAVAFSLVAGCAAAPSADKAPAARPVKPAAKESCQPRFDAGRLLIERYPSKRLLVEDNLEWLRAGRVPEYAQANVVKWLELKGQDMSEYRRTHKVPAEPPMKPFAKDFRLGYMLDISRCKVPTLDTLKIYVDILSAAGFSEFQLYTEHTFAYRNHETAWRGWSPVTAEDVRALDAYAWSKGVRLVPNQNSFGHLEKWLRHGRYRDTLAETPNGYKVEHPPLNNPNPCAICPTDPKSLEFLGALYDELLPNFAHSDEINVGCDEVWDIFDRNGRSAAVAAKIGVPNLYMKHLLNVRSLVKQRGKRMAFWADMVLRDPELLDRVPKDVNALQWGYGSEHETPGYTCEFEGRCIALSRRGIPYTVCPSTISYMGPLMDIRRAFGNIRIAAESAAKFGAEGLLLTEWGDGGHPNALVASVAQIVYAGLLCRNKPADEADVVAKVNEIVDAEIGAPLIALWSTRREGRGQPDLVKMRTALDSARRGSGTAPGWVRNGLAVQDMHLRVAEARKAGKPLPEGLRETYRRLWLEANRPGGFDESIRQLKY